MLKNFDKNLESIDNFETDYVKILYYDLPQNFSSEYKSYNYSRICTIIDGEKNVILNGDKKFTYDKNSYLLLPPESKVHMDIPTNTKALVFELSDQLIKSVAEKIDFDETIREPINPSGECFLGKNKFNVLEDVNNIFNKSQNNKKNSQFLIDLYSQKLIFDLLNENVRFNFFKNNNSHPINLAIKYIDENINSMISIKELSDNLYMSESNFSNLFKKTVGVRPVDYITNKKMKLALEYLKTQTVTEVAYNLGYSNISYFIKLFKNKYKITPKRYKLN